MALKETLAKICEGTEGGVLCTLMSFDGIPVGTYEKPGAGGLGATLLVVEAAGAARALDAALIEGGRGGAREMTVTLEGASVILRPVDGTRVLVLALEAGGNFGRGRYLLRVAAPRILEDL